MMDLSGWETAATAITSSPFLIALSFKELEQRVLNVIKLADDPELTVNKNFEPKNLDNFFSKRSLNNCGKI